MYPILPPTITPIIDQIKKSSIILFGILLSVFLLISLIRYIPNKKPTMYANPYHLICIIPKEKMTGSIEGCNKTIIFNKLFIHKYG